MDSVKHTPGSWDLYVEGKGGGSRVESLGREIPAGWGLFRAPPQMSEDEGHIYMGTATSFTQADTRLIAAAPDLLEALQHVARVLESKGKLLLDEDIVEAAIAKATDDERLRTLGHKRA